MTEKHWHKSFFNYLYYELFMQRSKQQVDDNIRLIETVVDVSSFKSVMDVCCGIGDICASLADKHHMESYGIEYSADYVKHNRIKNIIHGDARELQTNNKFCLVINWWSSFSYFNHQDNLKILKNCYQYTNDVFLLETYNSTYTINQFNPHIQYDKTINGKRYLIDRISKINLHENILEQDFIIFDGILKNNNKTFTYLYMPKDIVYMLYQIGFKSVELFGIKDYQLCPLTMEAPRVLIKAKK